MEPMLVIALGLLSLMSQIHNYGIDLEKNPQLKNIRVRRQIESQPYDLEHKDENPTELPEEFSLKSLLKGDRLKKREAFMSQKNVKVTNDINIDSNRYNAIYSSRLPEYLNPGILSSILRVSPQQARPVIAHKPSILLAENLNRKKRGYSNSYGSNAKTYNQNNNGYNTNTYNNNLNTYSPYQNNNSYISNIYALYPNNNNYSSNINNKNNNINNQYGSGYDANGLPTRTINTTMQPYVTTTEKVVEAKVLVGVSCPGFFKSFKVGGKRWCGDTTKDLKEDSGEDYIG